MSSQTHATMAALEGCADHSLGQLQTTLAQFAADGEGFDVFDMARRFSMDSTTSFVTGTRHDTLSAVAAKPQSSGITQSASALMLSAINLRHQPDQLAHLRSLAKTPEAIEYKNKMTGSIKDSMYALIDRMFNTDDKTEDSATLFREPLTILDETWRASLLKQAFDGDRANNPDTARIVTTALYFLAHPRAACKYFLEDVRNELSIARQRSHLSDPPTMAELAKLPYLQALIKESVRWISLGVKKFQATDNIWPMGKEAYASETYLSNGARFSLDPPQWNRIKDIWGSDPLKFRAQRFVVASEKDIKFRNKLMVPFGFDDQGMPGQCLSLMESSKIIFHFLDTYDFEHPSHFSNFEMQLAQQKVNNLWLRLKPKGSGMKLTILPAPIVRLPPAKQEPAPVGIVQKISQTLPSLRSPAPKQLQAHVKPTTAEPKTVSAVSHQRSESASSSKVSEAKTLSTGSGPAGGHTTPDSAKNSAGIAPSPYRKDGTKVAIDGYNASVKANFNRGTNTGSQHRGNQPARQQRGGQNWRQNQRPQGQGQRPQGQGQGQGRSYADRNRTIQPRPKPTGPPANAPVVAAWANFAANAQSFDDARAKEFVEKVIAERGEPPKDREVTVKYGKLGSE